MPDLSRATDVVCRHGWLSQLPVSFQQQLLPHMRLHTYTAGQFIYRRGDPLGGIYGLVSGVVAVDIAPPGEECRLVQYGTPGSWTGEGCFLTRQPRRLDLRACGEVSVIHVPLAAMDELARGDAAVQGYIAQMLMSNVYVLMRIVHDLQIPQVDRRIASTMTRLQVAQSEALPITQTELGQLANASRRQVAAAFKRFIAQGWVEATYRSVRVTDAAALGRFALAEEG
ncbi:Crp/Fnr family transcriptional regulator [Stenotrophomonas sp.]|uniref:Crp/Fnr family transcriptional regulator n=1 Tax=Stenotrophomonas sp. TaxID=69392 RepID=UPI0028A738B2|nr:Crp/Fnr family transcriptional regulator [Stenotrophomonas sp.]